MGDAGSATLSAAVPLTRLRFLPRAPREKQPVGGTRRRWGDLCNVVPARFRWGSKLTNPPGGEHASDGRRAPHARGGQDGTAGVTAREDTVPRGLGQPWLAPQPRKPAVARMAPRACIHSTGSEGIGFVAAAVAARLPTSRSQIASK